MFFFFLVQQTLEVNKNRKEANKIQMDRETELNLGK